MLVAAGPSMLLRNDQQGSTGRKRAPLAFLEGIEADSIVWLTLSGLDFVVIPLSPESAAVEETSSIVCSGCAEVRVCARVYM